MGKVLSVVDQQDEILFRVRPAWWLARCGFAVLMGAGLLGWGALQLRGPHTVSLTCTRGDGPEPCECTWDAVSNRNQHATFACKEVKEIRSRGSVRDCYAELTRVDGSALVGPSGTYICSDIWKFVDESKAFFASGQGRALAVGYDKTTSTQVFSIFLLLLAPALFIRLWPVTATLRVSDRLGLVRLRRQRLGYELAGSDEWDLAAVEEARASGDSLLLDLGSQGLKYPQLELRDKELSERLAGPINGFLARVAPRVEPTK
jgi:hypothetical protein